MGTKVDTDPILPVASADRFSIASNDQMAQTAIPPFDPAAQLIDHLDPPFAIQHLPGYPGISLDDPEAIRSFLCRDLDLGDLERLAPKLWMMSTHDHRNISALHRQKVKGRQIVVSEDPKLHLVWHYDRIFIKPLPKYLLSAEFWQRFFGSRGLLDKEKRAALGYLRTFAYLIRHESDFRIAKRSDLCLVPENVSWEQFCLFIHGLKQTPASAIAVRYQYGEIRLTRLNFYCKFFLGKQHFQRVHSQYGQYFATYYAPLLFVFGALSLVLSAMQVELATEALSEQWQSLWNVCRLFSVITLFAVAVLLSWLASLFTWKFCKEWCHALQHRYRIQRQT